VLHPRLDGHGLEGLDPGDGLHQERLVLGPAGELVLEPSAQHRRDDHRQAHVERQRAEDDPGQGEAVGEHHREEHDGEDQIDDQRDRAAGEERPDGLLLAHAGHGVAHPAGFEVRHRQAQEVAEEPGPQLHVDAVGGMGEQVGAQRAQRRLEHRDDQEGHDQDIEGREPAVHQHLVDDHLEEQR
jgi:hypothetical protein